MIVSGCLESALIGEKVLKGGSTNYVAKAYTFVLCPFRHVLQLHENTSAWALADCRDKHTTGHEVACATLEAAAAKRAAALGGALRQMRGALAAEAAALATHVAGDGASERAPAAAAAAAARRGAAAPNAARAAGLAVRDAEKVVRSVTQSDREQTLLGVWRGWIKGSSHMRMGYEAPGPPCENGSPRRAFVTMQCDPRTALTHIAENGMCHYELTLATPRACSAEQVEGLRRHLRAVRVQVAKAEASAAAA